MPISALALTPFVVSEWAEGARLTGPHGWSSSVARTGLLDSLAEDLLH